MFSYRIALMVMIQDFSLLFLVCCKSVNDYKLSSEDKIFSFASAPIYVEILTIVTACERLILLDSDAKELRDYSILLYHCGFYEQSLQYLKLYQEAKALFSICDITSVFTFE
jgi:hypothetical protein